MAAESLVSAAPYGDAEGLADADGAMDAEAETDGNAEPLGTEEGSGTGVGSGMKREGMPRAESTMMSTKAAITIRIHGRARRSLRGGRAPR